MTTVFLAPTAGAFYQAFTAGGLPLNAGLLYTYSAGTTTPLASYTDNTGATPNANPIVLGADGRPPNEIWLDIASSYRIDVKDSAGNLIATYDNLYNAAIATVSSSIQSQSATAFTTTGTSTAYVLTPSPALTALAANERFCITFHTAAGATPTLAVSGLTAKNVKYRDSSGAKQAVTSTQIPTGWETDTIYDGTDWVIQIPSGSLSGIIGPASGGTGIANNAASTLTISGNFATTVTVTGATGITLPTAGTLATLAGTEALTNKTYNGNTFTAGTGVLTIAASKTLTASNTITLAGTDGTTMTFPGTTTTVAGLGINQTFTAPQRGTQTTANSGSYDLNTTNNFKTTTAGALALTFTNIGSGAGQSGNILFINASNHTITAAANTKVATGALTALSVTGSYMLGYYCDGTNVYVGATGALA